MGSLGKRGLVLTTTLLIVLVGLLVGGGSALANHVRCGQTITQDTTLDSDLIDCPGDGIVVGADNITLDIDGHTIAGSGSGLTSGAGIRNGTLYDPDPHDGVTIENGHIRDFWLGVSLSRPSENVIRGLSIERVFGGIYLSGHGSFIPSTTGDNVIVSNSLSVQGDGIQVYDSGRNTVRDNLVTAPNGSGIHITGGNENDVVKNKVVGSFDGIQVLETLIGSRVRNNFLSRNGTGVELTEAHGNDIAHNSASENVIGLHSYGSGPNRIVRNSFVGNQQDGILVDQVSGRELLESNVANANGDDGIDADSPGVVFSRNSANQNADLGIEAVEGVIDGGGNKAFGNGNPLQCLNIVCK